MSVLIDVKHIVLSFLQTYFENKSTTHPWSSTYAQTKIIIADKFAVDLKSIEKKPAIILSRGQARWTKLVMDQRATTDIVGKDKTYTDLVRMSLTLNIIGKNGIVLEDIASTLFNIFVGHKDILKAAGIDTIDAIEIGQEQVIQSDSEINLVRVPVSMVVTIAKTLASYTDSTFATILVSGTTTQVREGEDYHIVGQSVIMEDADDQDNFSITYLDNTDYTSHTEYLTMEDHAMYLPLTFNAYAPSGISVKALNAMTNVEYPIDAVYISGLVPVGDEIVTVRVSGMYYESLPSGITTSDISDAFKTTYYLDARTPVHQYILMRSGLVDYTDYGVYGDYLAGNWAYDPDETLSTYPYVSGVLGVINE